MPCYPIQTPGGFGFACTRGRGRLPRCYQCGKPAGWLCDFRTSKRTTCDRPICQQHGQALAGNRDYCRDHALIAKGATP